MNHEYIITIVLVGLLGSALGSFLNVVIYRLPRGESLAFPGSRCPLCGVPIRYRDNIPVLSYIVLGGRCRACRAPISKIYPLIEILTACMAVILFMLNDSWLNFTADLMLGLILLAVFFIDLRHMIIPDRLNIAGGVLAFVLSFRWGTYGILRGAAGAGVGLVFLGIMMLLGKVFFKRQGIGMGDMKLAAVIGLFVGPFWCFITFTHAVIIGGLWGTFQIISGKIKTGQEVPFGPFIALGGYSVLFFRHQILFIVDRYLAML
ncbi:prepilin peptidase [bacterium]|nr:prepilin peptidase [bacterium]